VALLALSDAAAFNLCQPQVQEVFLARHLRATPDAPEARQSAMSLPLPNVEVERSLEAYGRALPPAPTIQPTDKGENDVKG
jgi:hypothetical protein